MLAELLGSVGADVAIVPPFFCDYGRNTSVGSRVFVNTGCVILDCARVEIGDDVQVGPGVHLYAASHPLHPGARRSGLELAAPVTIGSDVWLAGRLVVCPGRAHRRRVDDRRGKCRGARHPGRGRGRRQPLPRRQVHRRR
ncbi:MAG: hypothetical protein ABSG81_12185 [Acidimicrobiales bacterium]